MTTINTNLLNKEFNINNSDADCIYLCLVGSTKAYLNTKRPGIRHTFTGCDAGLDRVAVVQLRVVQHGTSVAGPRLHQWRGTVDWRRGWGGCWLCLTIPHSRSSFFTLCEVRRGRKQSLSRTPQSLVMNSSCDQLGKIGCRLCKKLAILHV